MTHHIINLNDTKNTLDLGENEYVLKTDSRHWYVDLSDTECRMQNDNNDKFIIMISHSAFL